MEENIFLENNAQESVEYTEDNIRHLNDMEHIRTRPGMYIGRLGDGSQSEDGIYVLLKEVIDNSIDEFTRGRSPRQRGQGPRGALRQDSGSGIDRGKSMRQP